MPRIRRGTTAVACAAAGMLVATVGVGLAATGALTYRACFANGGAGGCEIPAQASLEGPDDVAVSPDGRSVFVTAFRGNSLTAFKRASDGTLTYGECFADGGATGCTTPGHDSLGSAEGVAVSPDGKSVYVVSGDASSITSFARSSGGALGYQGCIANAGAQGCDAPQHASLGWAEGVAVSPDGKSVYVAARDSSAVTWFGRAADGTLTYGGCVANAGANGCVAPAHDSLTGTISVAVSPDGKSVYAAAPFARSISRFDRAANGSLTYEGCISDFGVAGCPASTYGSLHYAFDVTVSADGRSVYVAAGTANSVTSFVRASDGTLSLQGCIANGGAYGCDRADKASLGFSTNVDVSPDGASVYVSSRDGNGVSVFSRASDGRLTYRDCIANGGAGGCVAPVHDSLTLAYGAAVSPDGTSIYVAALNHGLTVFTRELPPPETRIGATKVRRAERKATFRFSSSQPHATFRCRLDGRSWRTCSSPKTYRGLHRGTHLFKVEAKNSQGALDPSPARKRFRI